MLSGLFSFPGSSHPNVGWTPIHRVFLQADRRESCFTPPRLWTPTHHEYMERRKKGRGGGERERRSSPLFIPRAIQILERRPARALARLSHARLGTPLLPLPLNVQGSSKGAHEVFRMHDWGGARCNSIEGGQVGAPVRPTSSD
jgi:hypothetical protein